MVEDGNALSGSEQFALLKHLQDAQPIAYRKSEPTAGDFNTYIIGPRQRQRNGDSYLTWQVCRDVSFRQVRRPDRDTQTVHVTFEDTDDCQLARVVALPGLGVLAVEDSAGEGHLPGPSALGRFGAIVATHTDAEFSAQPAGSPQDLMRAIDTWDLERFAFQARPFNPHPSNPGKMLSDMMQTDGVGELRATVLPKDGQYMHAQEEGIIQEAIGLADKGYATFGAAGRTRTGAQAVVKKPKFSQSKEKNLEQLRGPQQLRVYVTSEQEDDKIRKMYDVLLDFFG